jgi:hypothetical protein
MSPSHLESKKMNLFAVDNNGALISIATNENSGVRATINVKGAVAVSGNGTVNNPYIINTEQK